MRSLIASNSFTINTICCHVVTTYTTQAEIAGKKPFTNVKFCKFNSIVYKKHMQDALKDIIRQAYKQLSNSVDGFRNRLTQRQMIGTTATTLGQANISGEDRPIAVIEAPTGTGKTVAYLTAAIPVAKHLEKRLVLATATIALQEQLMNKDLPMLARHSQVDISYRLAKGRQRYLCIHRLKRLTDDTGGLQFDAFWEAPPEASDLATLKHIASELNNHWDGDRDSFKTEIKQELWQQVSTNSIGCYNRQCKDFSECPFYLARAKIDKADVIIANHDLLLSDLGLGGGVILPKPSETLYIIDEAHQLPEKAISHFSVSTNVVGVTTWLENTKKTISDIATQLDKTTVATLVQRTTDHVLAAVETLTDLHRYLQSVTLFAENPGSRSDENAVWRLENGIVPEDLLHFAGKLLPDIKGLHTIAEKLKDNVENKYKDGAIDDDTAAVMKTNLGFPIERLANVISAWKKMQQPAPSNGPPLARWITRSPTDFRISISPVTANMELNSQLWSNCAGALLTSATLTANNSFERFMEASGLTGKEHVSYLQLPSPFNYQEHSLLYVPWMQHSPKQALEHTEEIIRLLPKLLHDDCGSLVLFSSRKQMEAVAEGLPHRWQKKLLIQGEQPKHVLLKNHKQRVEKGEVSVLFGLASFAEGIDLPGTLCTHVVIAKIPFAVPDSPVDATYAEWLQTHGRNPFMEVAVPDAGMRLVQASGRLLRKEDDYGQVSILDRRLVDQRYGRLLLQSLPPMPLIVGKPGDEIMRFDEYKKSN